MENVNKCRSLQKAKLPPDYDTYIFDLYGTLVDIYTEEEDDLVWEKLALFMGLYRAYYTAVELRLFYKELVQRKTDERKLILKTNREYSHEASPEIDIAEVFSDLYKQAGVSADKELIIHTGQFFRVLTIRYLRLYRGTKEMLSTLKRQGKHIFLLSNAQRIFTTYEMRYLGIENYFDAVFISSDYRIKKPDERFFRLLLDDCEIDSKHALLIGDDSKCDIEGAASVGLDTFYINSSISPAGDFAPDATYTVDHFLRWDY